MKKSYAPKLNYGPHIIQKSDTNALVEEELAKGWKTTTQNGQKVYADGPHKGKRVGSIRGKGGKQAAKTKPYNPAEEGIQAAKKDVSDARKKEAAQTQSGEKDPTEGKQKINFKPRKDDYSWGSMRVLESKEQNVPMHPEHWDVVSAVASGKEEKGKFKDETGTSYQVEKMPDGGVALINESSAFVLDDKQIKKLNGSDKPKDNPAAEGERAAREDAQKEKPEDEGPDADFKKLSSALNEHGGGFGAHAHERHGPDAQGREEMSPHDKKLWDALDQAGLDLHEKAIFYDSKRGRWAMDQIENSDFVNKQVKEFKNELSSWDKNHYKKFHDAINNSKE